MKLEEHRHVQGTSREDEEKHLEETLDVIHANMDSYGRQVREMKADIDEMLEHYHDDDAEVYVILTNTITLHDHMKRALERNEKAVKKPYFGRICFLDESTGKEESIYIGRGGISRDSVHQEVIDWRAPVANAYYENGLGRCSYLSPSGTPLWIDLQLKRTYEIDQGKLLDYFDSEVISNDDLLTKYLARNKQAVLGEIVATIQKEQNEIIRKSPYHNIIVQGVAGSGKTTVAMHRISFILYNYAERIRPEDFYIVGSNRILLNYITGVLPSLDVNGVRQMTMEQLFVRLLYEDWDEKKYCIRKGTQSTDAGKVKGTEGWFQSLKLFCDQLERSIISCDSIYLNPREFVEGIENGRNGVYDRSQGMVPDPKSLVLLVDGQAVERYIRQNPAVSIQSKINMLNERLLIKVKDEFLGKGVKYTEAERKAILKAYRNRYGGKGWKLSTYKLYDDFLKEQATAGIHIELPGTDFDVYDLAALAYIYKRTKETEVISEAHHIVIDEAQDFGMMVYNCLHFCIKDCTYTVMGDVSQNIRFGFGLNDWEELKRLLLEKDPMSSFGILKKSYRNTVEISHFATDILSHGKFMRYPVEPIIRHGNPVEVREVRIPQLPPSGHGISGDVNGGSQGTVKAPRKNSTPPKGQDPKLGEETALWQEAARQCRAWQEKELPTIAVICRDQEGADRAAKGLGTQIEIMETDPEKAEFGNGIMVLPVEYTKGLEFDAVLILNPTREEYPVDDGHARLLYVAATRALHELCVLHTGNLTGLIADPVPEPENADRSLAQEAASPENPTLENSSGSSAVPDSLPPHANLKGTAAVGKRASEAPFHKDLPNKIPGIKKPKAVAASPSNRLRVKASAATTGAPSPGSAIMQTYRSGKGSAYTRNDPVGPDDHASQVSVKSDRQNVDQISQGNSFGQLSQSALSCPPALGKAVGGSFPDFGDFPPTEKLRPLGHNKIDLSVRWVSKQPDGLYLQSRYGILRLSPVGSGIVRVTFSKNGKLLEETHPLIRVRRLERFWTYKESGLAVTLSTEELVLQAEKSTGAIRYLSRDKKLLLAERGKECRQQEAYGADMLQSWLFLEFAKKEQIFAMDAIGGNAKGGKALPMRGTARYISSPKGLPFLFSDQGYGILTASQNPVIGCDMPAYGTYLHTEGENQMDYYFIAGKKPETLMNACRFLMGEL